MTSPLDTIHDILNRLENTLRQIIPREQHDAVGRAISDAKAQARSSVSSNPTTNPTSDAQTSVRNRPVSGSVAPSDPQLTTQQNSQPGASAPKNTGK
jgi:hypothetical protein